MALGKRAEKKPPKSKATSDNEANPAHPHWYRPVPDNDGPLHENPRQWNSATTAKITLTTRENVFASMSHHSKFLTQDSTQGAGGCERRANVITGGLRQRPSRAGSRLETSTSTCSSPMRIGRSGSRGFSRASRSFPRCRNWTTTSDECGSPDVSPCKGQYDHYQNHHQAHFCPQVVGQAVAFVVALHSHDLPSGRQSHG